MATYTPTRLSFGQLPDSKGDVCAPSGGAVIHNIVLHNANTTAEIVKLLYSDGSNEYQIYDLSIDARDTVVIDFRGEGLVLPDAAKITGNTTTASKVTYVFNGTIITA
jgi:ribosomal protein L2